MNQIGFVIISNARGQLSHLDVNVSTKLANVTIEPAIIILLIITCAFSWGDIQITCCCRDTGETSR